MAKWHGTVRDMALIHTFGREHGINFLLIHRFICGSRYLCSRFAEITGMVECKIDVIGIKSYARDGVNGDGRPPEALPVAHV